MCVHFLKDSQGAYMPCQKFMNSPAVIVIQAEVCSTHFTDSQLLLLK